MQVPHFVGASYEGISRIVGYPFSCNVYPDSGTSDGILPSLRPTPGYTLRWQLPQSPIRAIFWQDGRGFAVSGSLFCEFFQNGGFVVRGTVAVDGNPAFLSSNGEGGSQVFVVSGGHGYIFDLKTSAFTDVTTQPQFPAPALTGGFVGSYFWALMANSVTFSLSNIEDGTIWDINQGGEQSISLASDNIQGGIASHAQLWFPGSKTTSVWFQSGAADFPFQPIPGTYIQWGTPAPFSLAQHDNGLIMVGQNEQGSGAVLQTNGYDWQIISTPGIAFQLQSVPSLASCVAWTYAMSGHPFYVLYVPGLTTSLVYDGATKLWHNRGLWNATLESFIPDLGRCCTYGFGDWLVGDRQSGAIYAMRENQLTMDVVLT